MTNILIIEDDPYVRRFYDRLFRLNNYEVEIAASGPEGIEKAKLLKPTLILLDIMMPEMDGLTVLGHLKTMPETKEVSVVMLTNLSDEKTMQDAVRLGATGFIIKSSTEGQDLLKIVDQYVQSAKNFVG